VGSRPIRTYTGVARTLPHRGVVGLRGEGAIAGIEQQSRFEEYRSVSIAKRDAFGAVQDRTCKAGDVISIRCKEPKSGPDMRVLLSTTSAVYEQRNGRSGRLITGGRVSGGTPGSCAGPVRPGARGAADRAAAKWRPRRDRRYGSARSTSLCLGRRLRFGVLPGSRVRRMSGGLWKFAQPVGTVRFGALTHPGGVAECDRYAAF
jgi:dihydroxy-acid dehydratase